MSASGANVSGSSFFWNALLFTRALRAAGLTTDESRALDDISTRYDNRTLVYEAAWARDEGHPIDRLAPMAKLFACQTYRDTTAMCQQVWGGVGFSIEYDIQLYFRRAKQLELSWWDTRG